MRHIRDFGVSRSTLENIISEWVFNIKHREILKLRYLDGYPFDEIADRLDISTPTVKNVIYKYEKVILEHI